MAIGLRQEIKKLCRLFENELLKKNYFFVNDVDEMTTIFILITLY